MKNTVLYPIFFVSPVLNRALGLEKVVPNFHIITKNYDPLVDILREKGVSVFCLEEQSKDIDNIKNSFQILKSEETENFIQERSGGLKACILTFKSLPQIKKLCEDKNYIYLQSDPYIVRDLEDKVFFHKLLEDNKIQTVPSQVCSLENCKWTGRKSILQLRHGHSGDSTFVFDKEPQLIEFKKTYAKHQVRYSDFIEGKSLTINGCITDSIAHIGPPFYQITGIPELTLNEFGTCGNSHFALEDMSHSEKKKFFQLIDSITGVIQSKGFRGFFGLDILWDSSGCFWPIECNPRLTASIGNFTQAELFYKKDSLLLSHIKHFLKLEIKESNFMEDYKYSFLVLRSNTKEKKIPNNIYQTGTYKNIDNPEYRNANIDFGNLKEKEFIISSVAKGQTIFSNKEFLFLVSKEKLFDGSKLSNKTYKFIELVNKKYWK